MIRLCLPMETDGNGAAPNRWILAFVQQMLADFTQTVTDDAIDERELIEGLRVVAKVVALCTELSLEPIPSGPISSNVSDTRLIGGPNPDGDTSSR